MSTKQYNSFTTLARTPDLHNLWVIIQEKIDGSQFSFCVDEQGKLQTRSKNTELGDPEEPVGQFGLAIKAAQSRKGLLREGCTYRGEFLSKPKHNVLRYNRVPKDNVILFDVELPNGSHFSATELEAEAARIGLECVPHFTMPLDKIDELLELESVLGGCKIEGVVVKANTLNPPMRAKVVSDAFKEVHVAKSKQKRQLVNQKDPLGDLAMSYRTEARWHKAIQHLRDDGKLTNTPRDIGPLLGEISRDIKAEEADAIKEALFKIYFPVICKTAISGFADFYNDQLAGVSK